MSSLWKIKWKYTEYGVRVRSENQVNQMARLTDFELDVKEPQWT